MQQKEMFKEIREEREHICVICWCHIHTPTPTTFAHILNKWMYSTYKFDKNNIALVCGVEHHHEVDRRRAWNDSAIKLLLDMWESPISIICQ